MKTKLVVFSGIVFEVEIHQFELGSSEVCKTYVTGRIELVDYRYQKVRDVFLLSFFSEGVDCLSQLKSGQLFQGVGVLEKVRLSSKKGHTKEIISIVRGFSFRDSHLPRLFPELLEKETSYPRLI